MKGKVLIVNKFYYPRGGDCVCAINLGRLLRDNGYETAVFAMDYRENISCEWSSYFASNVDFSGGIKNKLRAFKRILGLGDIRNSFLRILDDFDPDIVHLHNIHSYLSPVLAVLAHERGKKVVWTLHDYKLVCPAYNCMYRGAPCEACVGSSLWAVVNRRCMKGSLAASLMAYVEARRWSREVLEKNVDAFICPSAFMKEKMIQGGFSPEKLFVNCNFLDFEKFDKLKSATSGEPAEKYYCYIGRLSAEKGIEQLLSVAARLPYRLKVAGGGPLLEELKQRYSETGNIEFLGMQPALAVSDLLKSAVCSVVPSLWYENNPLSVIESLCAGTPVVGASIGGIPELIEEGHDGFTFESGNAGALEASIEKAFDTKWDKAAISAEALSRFSAQTHLALLEQIYVTCK